MNCLLKNIGMMLFVVFFFSCSEKNRMGVSKKELYTVSAWVDNWSDSIFISHQVASLQIDKDKLYFVDRYSSTLFEIDKKFELKRMFGRNGLGPNEFISIEGMKVSDSLFYVCDAGHAAMIACNEDGKFVNQYKLADYQIAYPLCRFVVDDSCFIIASEREEQAFLAYNMQTGSDSFFGEKTPFTNEKQFLMRNNRHIWEDKDKYISVSDNLPYIELYDKASRQLIKRYDYSDIDVIQDVLLENEGNNRVNSYNFLVSDIYVEKDYLYLIIYGREGKEPQAKHILKFNLLTMEVEEPLIQLPGEMYKTFCVENDTIYAFNAWETRIEMLTKEK